MVYTIKIKDKSRKAKSIINFIEISEEQENQDDKIMNELEVRYNAYLGNSEGKEWNILMKEL